MPKTIEVEKETLLDLYINKRMTLKEVCIATGIKSDITLVKYMKKYGIHRRDTNTERSLLHTLTVSEEEFKKELLYSYIDEDVSVMQLSKKYKFSHVIIKKYLLKYGANIRSNKAGSKNPNWNGGVRYQSYGYKQILKPDHPNCDGCGYVYEHRYVMEQHLGRVLRSDEHIHHINGNKTDNRIKNLQLTNNKEHKTIEAEQRKKKREKNQLKMNFKDIE